ncbi:hypothetical protein M2232_004284 [Bradyrhizobium japonicum]|nr:hypothetical protein [Bradyrhizobium japonicum]MCW2345366.1 hypothetical protein [Bradyrhizobium japonicum]
MRSSPSIVPADRLDRDIYLVLEDFGARAGCAWRETDEADTDLETILQNLVSGQYAYPVRIVSFNPVEGWSRDATSEVADALPSAQPTPTLRSPLHYKPSSPLTPQGASTCS